MSYKDLFEQAQKLAPNLTIDQRVKLAEELLHGVPYTIWTEADIRAHLYSEVDLSEINGETEDIVQAVITSPGWSTIGFKTDEAWADLERVVQEVLENYFRDELDEADGEE